MLSDIEMPPEAVLDLPDCAPTKVLPQDLNKAINGIEVQKYYASDLLGIKENEVIPYESFSQINSPNPSNESEFISKVTGLLVENDVCDKVGIKFIAQVYTAACSKDANEFGQSICNKIKQSKSAVAKLATLYANAEKSIE